MKAGKRSVWFKKHLFCVSMLLILVSLIAALIIDGERIHYFNSREMAQKGSSKYLSMDIHSRGGKADSWTKDMSDGSPSCTGITYDAVLQNKMPYDVSQWNIRVNIDQPLFLNNAWCGTVEIHQKSGGSEIVQKLNLRSYNEKWIKLKYRIDKGDLLIPLNPGDYIIYYPSNVEVPIKASDSKDSENVMIGMILYTEKGDPVDLSDSFITYHFKKDPIDVTSFRIIVSMIAVWFCVFLIYIYIEWRMKAAKEKMENDERIIDEEFRVF